MSREGIIEDDDYDYRLVGDHESMSWKEAAQDSQQRIERMMEDKSLLDDLPDRGWMSVKLSDLRSHLDAAYAEGLREASKQVPTNWLDGLLTGKAAPKLPWNCPEIEKLLRGVQQRIERLAQQAEGGVHGTSEHE